MAAADRLDFIAARPDIANGVVVTDAARLDEARRALEKADMLPRLAVVVATSRTATQTVDGLPAGDPDRIVVDPHPGLYDKDKAAAEIARLEEEQEMLAARHGDQKARGRELGDAAARARRHAQQWPDEKLDQIEERRAGAAQALVQAQERESAAAKALQEAAAAEELAKCDEQAATEEHDASSKAQLRLAGLVEAEAAVAAWAAARPEVVEGIARHDRDALSAGTAVAEASAARELAEGEQRKSEDVAASDRERAKQLGVVPADSVPESPVHLLEARFAELDQRLADEGAGRDHLEALRRAQADVAAVAQALTGIPEEALTLAGELSTSVLAGTPGAIRDQAASAVGTWRTAVDRRAHCGQEVEKWRAEAERHRPTDRQVHATLGPEETPLDADDAARRGSEVDSRLFTSRALAARQAAAKETAERARDAAKKAASDFARLVSDQDAPWATADPYTGDIDAAFADLDQRRKAVTYAKELVADSLLARQRATAEVNTQANNRRWADIGNSLRELCSVAKAEELAEHGARYRDGLRAHEASLRSDIADLDTHRSAVIDSLGQTCDRLRRNLRQVRSASTIPTRVTNVGGHPAIIVDFKALPTDAANAALDRGRQVGCVGRRPERLSWPPGPAHGGAVGDGREPAHRRALERPAPEASHRRRRDLLPAGQGGQGVLGRPGTHPRGHALLRVGRRAIRRPHGQRPPAWAAPARQPVRRRIPRTAHRDVAEAGRGG